MASVLDSVNQRTQLVGENRLELLLFHLEGDQLYGINVFKVKEVLQCPRLHALPKSNPVVRGVSHIRGGTIPIVDMNHAAGGEPLSNIEQCFVIIAEYNCSTQGFLVSSVDRIVNLNWENVLPPPVGSGRENYLTAVTQVDNRLVEIIDVEKILAEISPLREDVRDEILEDSNSDQFINPHVLVVDDSTVARNQIKTVVESLGVKTTTCKDGREGLNHLKKLIEEGRDPCKEFIMVISDIEMPEMDGYTFTASVRDNPDLEGLYIVLHTSLSGVFNETMVKKVGADDFLSKFYPDELAKRVNTRMHDLAKAGMIERSV